MYPLLSLSRGFFKGMPRLSTRNANTDLLKHSRGFPRAAVAQDASSSSHAPAACAAGLRMRLDNLANLLLRQPRHHNAGAARAALVGDLKQVTILDKGGSFLQAVKRAHDRARAAIAKNLEGASYWRPEAQTQIQPAVAQ